MFVCSEPHYLIRKEERAATLRDYFEKVAILPRKNIYRSTIAELAGRIRTIDLGFIDRLIEAIPEKFLLDHFSSGRYCYQTATLADFLKQQFTLVAQQRHI